MVRYSAMIGRMHYGPSYPRERQRDSGNPSSNQMGTSINLLY